MDVTTESVDGDKFFDFVRCTLIPNMLPFDGCNERSIAIMGNCSVHHVDAVTKLFEESGIVLLCLPPYSPDLNPIETAFSYVKGYTVKTRVCCTHHNSSTPYIKVCKAHLLQV